MVTKELSTVVNLMTSVRVFFVPGRSGGGGSKVEGLELCIHNFNDVFQYTTQ